jgi:signal transduction histidine kinase
MDEREGQPGRRRRRRPRGSPLDGFFSGAPAWAVVALSVIFVAVVGLIDYMTGSGFSLAPFYLMPILLVTWNVGRPWGLFIAGLATVASQAADVTVGLSNGLVPSWNAVVWFGVFVFVVWLLSILRSAVKRQGMQLAFETERSDDLQQRNEMKDTLLHAVSHDLKGPLAGILGAMQTIRRSDQLELTADELEDLYRVIEHSALKATRLVDDLLDLDRLRRGQLKPDRDATDIVDLARKAAAEVPALAGHPVRVDGDPVLVEVDAAKVERIVENLLGNAGRHTPLGTPIHIEVHEQSEGVVLLVEDEGPGVPDEIKDEIFEPFRQGAASRGGVGIGLSLVRRFAELHGGSAHVEDRPGGGARFVVELPGAVSAMTSPRLHVV